MSDVERALSELEPDVPTIEFKTVKAQSFATYGADGAIGSITPRGNINLNFYIERRALPDSVIHAAEGDAVGKVLEVKGGLGFVRELQCALQLNPSVAWDLQQWLEARLSELGISKEEFSADTPASTDESSSA